MPPLLGLTHSEVRLAAQTRNPKQETLDWHKLIIRYLSRVAQKFREASNATVWFNSSDSLHWSCPPSAPQGRLGGVCSGPTRRMPGRVASCSVIALVRLNRHHRCHYFDLLYSLRMHLHSHCDATLEASSKTRCGRAHQTHSSAAGFNARESGVATREGEGSAPVSPRATSGHGFSDVADGPGLRPPGARLRGSAGGGARCMPEFTASVSTSPGSEKARRCLVGCVSLSAGAYVQRVASSGSETSANSR